MTEQRNKNMNHEPLTREKIECYGSQFHECSKHPEDCDNQVSLNDVLSALEGMRKNGCRCEWYGEHLDKLIKCELCLLLDKWFPILQECDKHE